MDDLSSFRSFRTDSIRLSIRGSANLNGEDTALRDANKKETVVVNYTKALVFVAFVVSVLVVGAVTYLHARDEENDNFQDSIRRYTDDMERILHFRSNNLLSSSESLALALQTTTRGTLNFDSLGEQFNLVSQTIQVSHLDGEGNFRQQYPAAAFSEYQQEMIQDTLDDMAEQELTHSFTEVAAASWIEGSDVEREKLSMYVYEYSRVTNESSFSDHWDGEESGVIVAVVSWSNYLSGMLEDTKEANVTVVLESTCNPGGLYTYQVVGPLVKFMGQGDLHDTRMTSHRQRFNVVPSDWPESVCDYHLNIYPSRNLMKANITEIPALYTIFIICVFMAAAAGFAFYDCVAESRHQKVWNTARRTNKIISNFFPSNVRDRILKDAEDQATQDIEFQEKRGFLNGDDGHPIDEDVGLHTFTQDRAIADFFPSVTIMFADIPGFITWSMAREPRHVFLLLETVFAAFDEAARQRRVFKVETVGDCYVAASGLPDPCDDHAVVVARFAKDIFKRMGDVTRKLSNLGPDTAKLQLRAGIHSGQITAGVLRGEKTRFQLFGDTMNTASRMESTGMEGRIQVSEDCAQYIMDAGKGYWLTERADKVRAKGKGDLNTFWLNTEYRGGRASVIFDPPTARMMSVHKKSFGNDKTNQNNREGRLIAWNSEILLRLLRKIQAQRQMKDAEQLATEKERLTFLERAAKSNQSASVINEVKDIISFPKFGERDLTEIKDPESIDLGNRVADQVRNYVRAIALLYRDNSFHNFEHASHVAMSTTKLLARVIAHDEVTGTGQTASEEVTNTELKGMSYGISSDPMTIFACVFAALIHDVDHCGVPNAQLVHEGAPLALVYENRSVAEQNAFDVAWSLLMEDTYSSFRSCIYSTVGEYERFRQLVVNSVMATDILDNDLQMIRSNRWERAFGDGRVVMHKPEKPHVNINRKSTLVVEYLIQAADISHTMQHWNVYTKWSERLFQEMYQCYLDGRLETDPSEIWYEGELAFFDYYVIPVAEKLQSCRIFGVSSTEYLDFANGNRVKWAETGREVMEGYMKNIKKVLDDDTKTG